MALDKDIVGSIEFLEVEGLQGSTYLLKGPNGEQVKLNQSEVADEDEFEIGKSIVSLFIQTVQVNYLQLKICLISPKINMILQSFKTDRDGARIDVGLPREVLVPWEDLPKIKELWPQAGDYLLVTLRIDSNNQMFGRLASETIVEGMFTPVMDDSKQNEMIEARAYRLLRVGSFLLSEDGYKIFVHESERKQEPRLGEKVEVRIIGHNDKGELNGSFLPLAHERLDDDGQVIFDLLVEYDGELPFWDKSSPEAIKEVFNMSKGSFKRAIGHLYKKKIINIETGKITLTKKGWSRVEE